MRSVSCITLTRNLYAVMGVQIDLPCHSLTSQSGYDAARTCLDCSLECSMSRGNRDIPNMAIIIPNTEISPSLLFFLRLQRSCGCPETFPLWKKQATYFTRFMHLFSDFSLQNWACFAIFKFPILHWSEISNEYTCWFISSPSNHRSGDFFCWVYITMVWVRSIKFWGASCGGKGVDWKLASWMHRVCHSGNLSVHCDFQVSHFAM